MCAPKTLSKKLKVAALLHKTCKTFVPFCGYSLRPQGELLYSPVQRLGDVDFILVVTVHCVDRTELFEEFARSAEFTDDLSVEGQLVDFPIVQSRAGIGVRGIEKLPRTGCNADCIWRSGIGDL